ncbi:MAG: ABC transporter substrate-binding protein [bacterium]|nr:ABC transporter substrate-binding protein [bacterium]
MLRLAALLASVLMLLAACGRQPQEGAPAAEADPKPALEVEAGAGNPQICVDSYDPAVDYFPDKAVPTHARQLRVEYFRHYKMVTLREPWHRAGRELSYLLVQCGTPRPEGFDGVTAIEIPVRTVITTSTTELPHVVQLGLVDRLVGHDEFDWVSSPEVRRRIDAGEMVEVGSAPSFDVERIAAAQADLLLVDSFGDPGLASLGKLDEVGVQVALAPSFLETTALGRAEWILYTSLFFNREHRAREAFAEVEREYARIAGKVRASVGGHRPGEHRPTVLTGAPIGDVWHVPGGGSYFALLLADAGAEYLWAGDPSTGSLPLGLESVFERALSAEIWLHPSTLADLAQVRAYDERFVRLAAFRDRRVFNNDARLNEHGGNDYWETGTFRADLVLADLVEIFHPEVLDHQLVFHRRLAEGG